MKDLPVQEDESLLEEDVKVLQEDVRLTEVLDEADKTPPAPAEVENTVPSLPMTLPEEACLHPAILPLMILWKIAANKWHWPVKNCKIDWHVVDPTRKRVVVLLLLLLRMVERT